MGIRASNNPLDFFDTDDGISPLGEFRPKDQIASDSVIASRGVPRKIYNDPFAAMEERRFPCAVYDYHSTSGLTYAPPFYTEAEYDDENPPLPDGLGVNERHIAAIQYTEVIEPVFSPEPSDIAHTRLTISELVDLHHLGRPFILQKEEDIVVIHKIFQEYYSALEEYCKANGGYEEERVKADGFWAFVRTEYRKYRSAQKPETFLDKLTDASR